MSSTQSTPKKDFYIHIGAPDPIIVQVRAGGADGTLTAFDSTLKLTFTNSAGTVTLGVSTGITLADEEAVTGARATAQLTVAQSRAIPVGALTTYEIQRTVGSREEVILMGKLIGVGGGNTDA